MITRVIMGLLSLALCAALVWLFMVTRANTRLELDNASLTRSVAALEQSKEQARLAAQVARANAARERAKAEEYDALRNALTNGGQDADLPEWFADYIRRVLTGGMLREN